MEMTHSRQRARDLLTAYDRSLEQQILGQGSSLTCRDEELWRQVEELLRDGDAQETHCLGLDPLAVMEESLQAAAAASTAATPAASGGRVKARGGLRGLAKAFEVLEQAALNLYLGSWRDEYKVVKMYSGTFTHHIKPVLLVPQIEQLFGLLGYQPSSSHSEQLTLQMSGVTPAAAAQDDLLRLSCAFYLARCECRLLQAALGQHVGEAQWELSVVRERQRGNNLQIAMSNSKKTLKAKQPVMEPFDGEVDVDLYTDEHVNGGQRDALVGDDKTWLTPTRASPPAGVTSSLSTSLPAKEQVCISTLSRQLSKMSAAESAAGPSASRRPCAGSGLDKAEPQSGNLQSEAALLQRSEAEADRFCICLQSPQIHPHHCIECKSLHNVSCALLQHCFMDDHRVVTSYGLAEDVKERGAALPQGQSQRDVSASANLSSTSAVMAALALHDDPEAMIHSPITYHGCCNLAELDPQVLCRSCGVFHSSSCRDLEYCQTQHSVRQLGVCSCGKLCSRKPLVLCRYCGNEYCRECWYRSPVVCTCGQTFDQSSSV